MLQRYQVTYRDETTDKVLGEVLQAETSHDAAMFVKNQNPNNKILSVVLVCEGQETKQNDIVNHPAHYLKGGIECIDVIKVCTEDLTGIQAVCTANIIKYIFRWKEKNGEVDVRKCRWYCDKLIKELEKENETI